MATGWCLSIGVRLAYPVMLPYLQDAYGLTLSTAGVLLTVLWLAYAIGQLPGGLVGDRIGEGAVMAVSMIVAAGTLTLVVVGGPAPLLFVATGLFGFALALFGTVRLSAMSDVYPENRGAAIGFISSVGDVGNTVIPPISGFLAATIAWQLGFGIAVPLFVLAGVGIWIVVPRRTGAARDTGGSLSFDGARSVLEKLHRPSILLVLAIQIFGVSIHRAFTGFYPLYLEDVKELSPAVASGLFALFFAVGAVIKPLSGRAYDRVGARRTLLILMGVSGAGFATLPLVEGFWPLVALTGVIGFSGGRGTVALSYMTVALPDEILNTGLGTVRTIYMVIGAASPAAFGAIADLGYFDEAFFLLAVASALTIAVALRLPGP